MHSFHYLSVASCVFSFFYFQLVVASGVQSSPHDRSRGLVHKRVPSRNHQPVQQSGDVIFSKRDTFTYFQDGQGACGAVNSPSDFIVALNSCDYNNGAHCFQTITITVNGKSTQAQITDECPGCPCGGLDFSEGLFSFFAPTSVGELSGTWTYGNGGTSTTSTSPPPPPPPTTTQQSSTSTWTPPPTTSLSSTSSTIITSSTPTTTSMSTTTSVPLPSTTVSSTASPVPTYNPNDPQMLTQVNLALIELGSVLQACAAMSF